MAKWVKSLPAAIKDDALVRFLAEEGDLALRAELLRMFRDDTRPRGKPKTAEKRRTVAQLLAARNALAEEKRRKAAEQRAREKAKREREQAEARSKYLDELARQGDGDLAGDRRPHRHQSAQEL